MSHFLSFAHRAKYCNDENKSPNDALYILIVLASASSSDEYRILIETNEPDT